jgi:excisionase family DNA binding protein
MGFMSSLEITPHTDEDWAATIRRHLEAGEIAEVRFRRPFLTPAQMAESLGVSRPAVMRRIALGQIRTERHGNRHRIPLEEVERFRHEYVREIASASAVDVEAELFGE